MRIKFHLAGIKKILLPCPRSVDLLGASGPARVRGPVSLVAIGRSDLEAHSRTFPPLANRILIKLAQIVAMRIQTPLEAKYFFEERSPSRGLPQ